MRLFVYGELCKPAVLQSVLARVPPAELALLTDYRRARDPSSGYFHVHPAPGGMVAGMLLGGIDDADLEALDEFENLANGEYRRVEVEVEVVGRDQTAAAWVYV